MNLSAGYKLLHDGVRALARVEHAGLRVDVPYVKGQISATEKRIEQLEYELMRSEAGRAWRKRFGSRTNLQARDQLAWVLVNVLECELPKTEKGNSKTDEHVLMTIDNEFAKKFLRISKLRKLVGTYLKGILREVVDGFIHPIYNLHIARTYRSSCEAPNSQNIPARDPEITAIIRRAFIPRKGRLLVDADYSGIEVRVAACYHRDPAMLRYCRDPSLDMHRDMAMECFVLPMKEITKAIRHIGKNKFVFPQFYGDYYVNCARNMWEDSSKVVTASGLSVHQHLANVGIGSLGDCDPETSPRPGTFEYHIRKVERRFWTKRFPVYNQWKKEWYDRYLRKGFIETFTGFVCRGPMRRNEAINYAIQGDAFHCLLWSLSRIVLHELPRRKMRSLIVGQVHDSITGDVVERELDDYCEMLEEIMVKKLHRHWKWIIVPTPIEISVSSSSWASMGAV